MEFEQLALDPSFPFRNFTGDVTQYYKAREFWESAFNSAGELMRWQNWMQDPLMDGNPILSKIMPSQHRGVIIQQVDRGDDPAWFKCWVDDIGDVEEGDFTQYLFVETFVSLPSAMKFSELARSWCHDLVSRGDMDRITAAVRVRSVETWWSTDFG